MSVTFRQNESTEVLTIQILNASIKCSKYLTALNTVELLVPKDFCFKF